LTEGKLVEGWELNFFVRQALRKPNMELNEVMLDVEIWLEQQA